MKYALLVIGGMILTACGQEQFGPSSDHQKRRTSSGQNTDTRRYDDQNLIDRQQASAPDSQLHVKTVCSHRAVKNAETSVLIAGNNLSVKLFPQCSGRDRNNGLASGYDGELNLQPIELTDPNLFVNASQSIQQMKSFPFNFSGVPDGCYRMILCDSSMHASCHSKGDGSGLGKKGELGFTDVQIQGGVANQISDMELVFHEGVSVPTEMFKIAGQLIGANQTGQIPNFSINRGHLACDKTVYSPLIIDLAGNGISLSSPRDGVDFDIDGDGGLDRISWTRGQDDMFLVYDENQNNRVDGASELFGPASSWAKDASNGFESLAKFDQNKDSLIDAKDSIFSKLKLWDDKNRNGSTEPGELITLASKGLKTIALTYRKSDTVDPYGNEFRQISKAKLQNSSKSINVVDVWFRVDRFLAR